MLTKNQESLRPFSSQIHDEKDGCFGFILAQRQLARKSQDSFPIIRRARSFSSYVCTSPSYEKGCKFFEVNTLMVDTRVILATVGATKSVALQFFGS